jgi:hypothetical protein
MKNIVWLLVVLVPACGRDRKPWAQKIDKLVQRSYACKDVACAKRVDEEMRAIISSDEGRNLEAGEPEFMLESAERIRNHVAKLEAEAKNTKAKAVAVLDAAQVFETSIAACDLAFGDLHGPKRAVVEAVFAKLGAKLPADFASDPKKRRLAGLHWHESFTDAIVAAMDGKVPVEDAIYAKVGHDVCIVYNLYDQDTAKATPKVWGEVADRIERIAGLFAIGDVTKDLVARLRGAASNDDVFAADLALIKALRERLARAK